MEFAGKAVTKRFPRFGVFKGVVESYDSSTGFFRILYEDGDSEEVELDEVVTLLVQRPPGVGEKVRKRPGRKPKRSRRIGVNSGKGFDGLVVDSAQSSGDSEIVCGISRDLSDFVSVNGGGKMIDLNNPADGLNSNGVIHMKDESLENGGVRGIIDLNVDVDHECGEVGKVKRGFDLNVGFSDDCLVVDGEEESRCRDNIDHVQQVNGVGSACNGTSAESGSTGCAYSEGCVSLCEKPNPASRVVVEADNVNDSSCGIEVKESSSAVVSKSPYEDGNSRDTKKRKVEVDSSRSATVLRRSARRASAMASEVNNYSIFFSDGSNDLSSSAVSVVTEVKPSVADCEEDEASEGLPPVVELPPSSTNLDLCELSVSDVFSVYACLRSFTTTLYLSPFGLDDLVAALKSNSPNSLLDSIHVSILQTIRKHLEFLSSEGSESASECLRNLNWDLLDVITWPIFMVEYLLIHGSGLQDGFNLASLKLFERDYYKQPAEVKMEVLRCLCDDMMEVDSIRSELDRRSMLAETGVDFDHNVNNNVIRKKRAPKGGICEDVNEDTTDWNSDECCLCKMDGNLICCDGCPAAYHARCVGVACNLLPEGEWYCPECSTNRSSGIEPQKLIRGAETLGVDPYGRLYFSSYGYLLVSDSCDAKSAFRYYHRNDLSLIINTLQSSELVFGPILSAISEIQAIHAGHDLDKSSFDSVEPTSHIDSLATEPIKPAVSSNDLLLKDEVVDAKISEENPDVMDSAVVEIGAEEESAEVLQGTHPAAKRGRKKSRFAGHIHKSSAVNTKEDPPLEMQPQNQYRNNYHFARAASSVAEELNHKSSNKVKVPSSEEEIISVQLKIILRKWSNFFWLGIPSCDAESQKEKCGWCYACRFPAEERDCLFNMRRVDVASEGLTTEIAGLHSKQSGKEHLLDVIAYVLSLEDRLRGILLGPWMSLHHSSLWRANVLEASDLSTVKYVLLMLEKSLRPQALSAEWLKLVDSAATMGSASHIVINSRAASRLGLSRKRLRGSDHGPTSRSGSCGLDLLWWRGGRLSRKLFNWKVLPRSIAAKAARQGGCVKIPGILYPDGSEHAKRSKHVAWRAAVETSTSVEQLALQVRELDQNIRWDDIENTHLLPILDNEAKKSIRLFKKVIVRRKAVEGTAVRYLLDFGKRRSIPDVVAQHGETVEDSSERKRYWLEDSYLPLHLLKGFEEKRIARKASKLNPNRIPKKKSLKKPFRRKSLEYLVSRAEREENYQCEHCKKDVPMSDAVCCRHCFGFFHQRHARKLSGTDSAKCTYACHKCLAAKNVIVGKRGRKKKKKKQLQIGQEGKMSSVGKRVKKRLVQISRDGNVYFGKKRGRKPKPKKGNKISSFKKQVSVEKSEVSKVHEEMLDSKRSADVSPDVALRRSSRVITPVSRQYAELVEGKGEKYNTLSRQYTGHGEAKELKYYTRRTASAHAQKHQVVKSGKRKRTPTFSSFWINGLKFSRKPNDELAVHFKRTKLLPSEISSSQTDHPKCPLYCEESNRSSLKLIACDECGGWFHGHAFGLDAQNVEHLIGFRCHLCLQKDPPKYRSVEDTKSSSILSNGAAKDAETENVDILPSEEADVAMEMRSSWKSGSDDNVQNVFQSTSDKGSSDDERNPISKLESPVETKNLVACDTEVGDKLSPESIVHMETDDVQKSSPAHDLHVCFQDQVGSRTDMPSSNIDQIQLQKLELETVNTDADGEAEQSSLEGADTSHLQRHPPNCPSLEAISSSGILVDEVDNGAETEEVGWIASEKVVPIEMDSRRKSGSNHDLQNLVLSTSGEASPDNAPILELPVETGSLAACDTEVGQILSEGAIVPVEAPCALKSDPNEALLVSLPNAVKPIVTGMLSDESAVSMEHKDLQVSLQGLAESTLVVPSSNTDLISSQQLQLLVETGNASVVETAFANTLSEKADCAHEAIHSKKNSDLHSSTMDSVESPSDKLCLDDPLTSTRWLEVAVAQLLSEEADVALGADGSHNKQDLDALTSYLVESTAAKSEFPTESAQEGNNIS